MTTVNLETFNCYESVAGSPRLSCLPFRNNVNPRIRDTLVKKYERNTTVCVRIGCCSKFGIIFSSGN